jgi:hypothetical protein
VEANYTRASLRASIAQALWTEVNAYFSFEAFVQSFELLLDGKHNAWMEALCVGVILTNRY